MNGLASGIMTFEGQAVISNSTVNSFMGESDGHRPDAAIIHVPGSYFGGPDDPPSAYARPFGAFNSSNTTYTNTFMNNGVPYPYSLAVILFDNNPWMMDLERILIRSTPTRTTHQTKIN